MWERGRGEVVRGSTGARDGGQTLVAMRGFHAVPRRPVPAVVTVHAGSPGRRRFLNLVVRAYREWDTGRPEEPVRYRVAG